MRKLTYCFLIIGGMFLTACRNQSTEMLDIKNQVKETLLNSVLHRINLESDDTSAVHSLHPFNFLLREGFAEKFGLDF